MSEEGSGNVGVLRGSCHDMEAFLRKQTELGGPLGPSGPEWPREYTNARNGHGLCHYPPAVRQAAAEREGYETTDDGRERPSTPSSVGPCIRTDEFRVRCRCLAAADAGQVQAGRRCLGPVAHDAQLHSRRGPRPALHVRKPLHAAPGRARVSPLIRGSSVAGCTSAYRRRCGQRATSGSAQTQCVT